MALNLMAAFASDIETIIADKLLPLAQNNLVVYGLGEPIKMPKGRGTTYTKTRYNRVPLPAYPLQEAVPAVGNAMAISQVTAAVQQWGGLIVVSDVATNTIKHDVMMKAKELIAIQAAETLERNTFNTLFGFTQVNTVNQRGSRYALQGGDTLGLIDLQRAQVQLSNIGAYKWMGTEDVNPKINPHKDADASSRKMPSPHYIVVCHEFVAGDLRMQQSFITASSYSDINKLYNSEVGQWAGDRVVATNMVPYFTGQALITGTPSSSGGALATSTTYNIIVTLSDPQRQYETILSQVSGNISLTSSGSTGSISVVLPASSYTYNVYIGTTSTPTNLGLCVSGPTTGPFQGQATQLAGGQTVVITGIGTPQTPPAPVATNLTVYPTWVLGKYAYSQVVLDDITVQFLDKADKADPFNQLREVTWLCMYGTLLDQNAFAIRIESVSQFSTTFS